MGTNNPFIGPITIFLAVGKNGSVNGTPKHGVGLSPQLQHKARLGFAQDHARAPFQAICTAPGLNCGAFAGAFAGADALCSAASTGFGGPEMCGARLRHATAARDFPVAFWYGNKRVAEKARLSDKRGADTCGEMPHSGRMGEGFWIQFGLSKQVYPKMSDVLQMFPSKKRVPTKRGQNMVRS